MAHTNYPKSDKIGTPKAPCVWSHLIEPDKRFSKKEDGSYDIELLFNPSITEHGAFLTELKSIWQQCKIALNANGKECKNYPWKKYIDYETKSETGEYSVKFSSGYKPFIVDSSGNQWPDKKLIGNGSKLKVCFLWTPYEGFGGGVTKYLQAVQVIDYIPRHGASMDDFGFTEEDGYVVTDESTFGMEDYLPSEEAALDDMPGDVTPSEIPEDEIPF